MLIFSMYSVSYVACEYTGFEEWKFCKVSPLFQTKVLKMLYKYTAKWHLIVNIEKKIVIFRNWGKLQTKGHWSYNRQFLNFVDSFTYFSVIFKFNCKFLEIEKS